jgi:predicted nucleotidyltransferase
MTSTVVPVLPRVVAEILATLAREDGVQSVWLIGSRANGTATGTSDWDLLVLQEGDPVATKARHPDVDVLRVGPSKAGLLEGRSETFLFSNFEWQETPAGLARYRGKRPIEYPEGQILDSTSPRFDRPNSRAIRLWTKG